MQNNKVLIIGCGDIGIPLAQQLMADGARVWGLRRQPQVLLEGIVPLAADVTDARSLSILAGLHFDYVVLMLTPAGFSPPGYHSVFVDGMNNILNALKTQTGIKRVLHVSSTRVYHQCDGEWVDETSPTEPDSFAGRSLLQAEQLLLGSDLPATVVRFAGIYGPGRRRLIEQVLSGQGCPRQPPLYTNRIHRDDCVGVLAHLLARCDSDEPVASLYIGVDGEPVPMWEIKHWLAEQLNVELDDNADVPKQRRNSKRCSNQRLLACGYQFRYPGYREGYLSLLKPS